jgi:sigma-B regulation protein RsbU (phosphoserine phosphatase)
VARWAEAARQLLTDSAEADPLDLAVIATRIAPLAGAREVHLYLVDYSQSELMPFGPDPDRRPVAVDGSLPGRCFQLTEAQESVTDGIRRWLPICQGRQRLGVLEAIFNAPPDQDRVAGLLIIAGLLGELITNRSRYGDAIEHTRRRLPMQLATEIVWGLLPPLTFQNRRACVTAILEPCYEVGGDAFDYAVNGDVLHLALFDAVGHGIAASMAATLTINAYRNARRCGLDLVDTYRSLDKWVSAQQPDRFVTAILAELDLRTGQYRRICAGHPSELLLRDRHLIRELAGPTALPIGLAALHDSRPVVAEEILQPGDLLVFYTDGVVEARSAQGEFFGLDQLTEFLVKSLADRLPPPESMRRLVRAILAHQYEQLQDDATALCVEWRGP